jgi:hypothetical protein
MGWDKVGHPTPLELLFYVQVGRNEIVPPY